MLSRISRRDSGSSINLAKLFLEHSQPEPGPIYLFLLKEILEKAGFRGFPRELTTLIMRLMQPDNVHIIFSSSYVLQSAIPASDIPLIRLIVSHRQVSDSTLMTALQAIVWSHNSDILEIVLSAKALPLNSPVEGPYYLAQGSTIFHYACAACAKEEEARKMANVLEAHGAMHVQNSAGEYPFDVLGKLVANEICTLF
eukprot:TRINITY_DN11461_c0_g1_i1.p1 TRINITY_DN11461_c0_g1~~TRINITY_DN11461_c0_g1_i1.p1  ORF type:complete len:198 (-),score=20.56 TRINITY_DN11461_c0_g1_i1:18-611(-)